MHRDLLDIKKILALFPKVDISAGDAEVILSKICEKTNDLKRIDKIIEANEKNDFVPFLGAINAVCKSNSCVNCAISKWCNHNRNVEQRKEEKRKALTYADFFCGSGGLSWGFHRAGFKLSLANDIQDCCIDTLSLNHPEVPGQHIITGDINDVINNITSISRYKNVDIVVGGPPCQGFSMANRQRLIDDPRNHLYKSYIKAISILKPKFFVMENVRGMLGVKKQIVEDFASIGYTASAHILNAKDFGIPQNRERVIFIGNRVGINNEDVFDTIFSVAKMKKPCNLEAALFALPALKAKTTANATEQEDKDSGYTFDLNTTSQTNIYINSINENRNSLILFNHKARYNNPRDIEIYSRLNPGDNSADEKIADIMPYKRREKIFKDKYFRLDPNKVCKTITAHMKYDCNMYIHPYQARGLTPREAARIQSYPDDYFFRGSFTKTYMQVGNSVPPLLSEVIATSIQKHLKEN